MQTVGAIQVLQLIEAWAELGVDRGELCRAAGMSSRPREDGRQRLPWRCVPELFAEAERLSGDPLIGLRAGTVTRSRGLPAYLSRSSATVGDGLRSYARLARHVADPLRLSLDVGSTRASLGIELASIRSAAPILEYLVGAHVRFYDAVLGGFHPTVVDFPHRARGPVAEYERILGGPVRFRQPACRITLHRSVLDLRMPTANPLVARVIEGEMRRERSTAEAGSIRARVERAIEELVDRTSPGGGRQVARWLGVSVRTLQRSLEREGTSLREVRGRVLRELAEESLADPALPVAAIAARLGFADAASFGKAFRRWTGETPTGVRLRSAPTRAVR